MAERVLLAGCGDLGLRLAHRLLARGAEVWALRRHPPEDGGAAPTSDTAPRLTPLPSSAVADLSAGHNLAEPTSTASTAPLPGMQFSAALTTPPSCIHWIQGDLTRPETLTGLPNGITQVVYLPAPGSRDPAVYRAVFQDGLAALLAALNCAALKRVLFISSTAVYGEHHGEWVDETTPANPIGFNGRILLDTERWLAAQAFSTISLRLAGLYGPGRLQLIERIRAGSARAPQHPPHWANRIHIDDAASAVEHVLALPHPDTVYLGSDDTPLPLYTLYAHLAELTGATPPAEGPAPANVGSKKLSNARLRASGWTPQWPDSRTGYAALLHHSLG